MGRIIMPNFKIKVKWGKEIFQDVEVNTDEEPMVFKAQLFALTGVQPERQKVMQKGAILDQSWDKVKVKDGIMMLMMGTKDEDMPSQPVEKTKFVEDMDERELSRAMDMPAGLQVKSELIYSEDVHLVINLTHTNECTFRISEIPAISTPRCSVSRLFQS